MLTVAILIASLCQTPAVPVSPSIRLPVVESPTPPPLPPNSVQVLPADKYYVIDSDVECFVRTLPKGLLLVAVEAGPIKLPTKSLVEGGKAKFKTYSGKFIYVVESTGDGRVELLVVPKGVAADKDILQRSIDAQTGAKPPPDPVDPPKPEPSTIAKKAIAWYAAVKSPAKQMEGQLIRSVFYVMATQDAGKFKTLEEFGTEIRNRCRGVVADANEAAWREAFFTPLMAELEKSAKTVGDCERICADLAAGLKEVVK